MSAFRDSTVDSAYAFNAKAFRFEIQIRISVWKQNTFGINYFTRNESHDTHCIEIGIVWFCSVSVHQSGWLLLDKICSRVNSTACKQSNLCIVLFFICMLKLFKLQKHFTTKSSIRACIDKSHLIQILLGDKLYILLWTWKRIDFKLMTSDFV